MAAHLILIFAYLLGPGWLANRYRPGPSFQFSDPLRR